MMLWTLFLATAAAAKVLRTKPHVGFNHTAAQSKSTVRRGAQVPDIALNQSVASIINGAAAAVGEFPTFSFPTTTGYCGASLIWSDVLVTAAHCSEGFDGTLEGYPPPIRIHIGGTKADGSNAVESIAVDWALPHPDYVGCDQYLRGDIMLVFLEKPATTKPSPWNKNPARPVNRQVLTTIGHGETASGELSFDLLKASVTVMDTATCADLYLHNRVMFGLNHICTVARPQSACRGDSGGPLFGNNGILLGLTSGGASDCVEPDLPNRYTRISTYTDWIWRNICHYSARPPTDGTCQSYPSPCANSGSVVDDCLFLGTIPGTRVHRTLPGSTCKEQCYAITPTKGKFRRGWNCGGCPLQPVNDNCQSNDDA